MASMGVGGGAGGVSDNTNRRTNHESIHPSRFDEPSMIDPFILRALHSHLRSSLFNKTCADIQICAFQRTYALHRVFLVQSTFFHSLLNGEFYEAQSWQNDQKTGDFPSSSTDQSEGCNSAKVTSQSSSSNAVELHFDDPNITRPAFEYCIASLYGSAPRLVLPTWASPCPTHPLTQHFEADQLFRLVKQSKSESHDAAEDMAYSSDLADDNIKTNRGDNTEEEKLATSKGPQQPATPRFLLSLLATAAYLGIPSVTAQAITLILSSITPFTVSHYLRFALGFGIYGAFEAKERRITNSSIFWDWELEGPAWGLANLASEPRQLGTATQCMDDLVQQTSSINLLDNAAPGHHDDRSKDEVRPGENSFTHESFEAESQDFYYGTQWDKIGEACSCWLLRWGADVLLAEEQLATMTGNAAKPDFLGSYVLPRNSMPVEHSLTFDDCPLQVRSIVPAPYPTVWCHPKRGGIPANWARAIISSDSFWIREEWDRYEVARKVVSMRRSFSRRAQWRDEGFDSDEEEDDAARDKEVGHGEDRSSQTRRSIDSQRSTIGFASSADEERDEREYERLFGEGIYYTHLSFARLSSISNDLCPYTGHAYAPINVLQGSLWTQSELKNIILSKDPQRGEDAVLDTRTRNDEDDEETRGVPEERRESKDMDTERELGLVSSTHEFVKALASIQKRGRPSFAQKNSDDHRPTTLGGVTPLMQPFSFSSGSKQQSAIEGLLSKRFFAVPVDDTIRMGENLASLSAAATAVQQQQNPASSAHAPPHKMANVFASHEDAPSGVASAMNSHTLSLFHENKRTASVRFFGLENAVQPGKEVGRLGVADKAAVMDRHRLDSVKANIDDTSTWTRDAADDTTNVAQQGSANASLTLHDWSGFEPMRIGVEFFDVDRLSEKQRLYSPSFFYAGSVWNLYVQTVKKPKGLQLGIYLHRQNCNDNLPSPSLPARALAQAHGAHPPIPPSMSDYAMAGGDDSFATTASSTLPTAAPLHAATGEPRTPQRNDGGRPNALQRGLLYSDSPISSRLQTPLNRSALTATTAATSVNSPSRITTRAAQHSAFQPTVNNPAASPDADGQGTGTPGTFRQTPNVPAGQASNAGTIVGLSTTSEGGNVQSLEIPYYDHRRVLRAYFSIHCPSPMGTSLTKFSSRPDNFTLSQSWGWKSSSLLGAVYLDQGQLGTARSQVSQTFRCVVTMGVV